MGFSFASVVLSYFLIAGGTFFALLLAGRVGLQSEYLGYIVLAIGGFLGGLVAARASRGSTIIEPALGAVLMILTFVGIGVAASGAESRVLLMPAGMKAIALVSAASAGGGIGGAFLGEKLFGDDIDLHSDPLDAQVPGAPWSGDHVPQTRTSWIEQGTLAALRHDRYWADKKGVAPVPAPSNLILAGGTGTVDDLVASTERGVLVTSLWYIRSLDPRTLLYTGLTRDGVFWIENGKISHPVTNFRWNDSPIAVLKNIVARSAAMPTVERGAERATSVVPALKVSAFHLASISEAV